MRRLGVVLGAVWLLALSWSQQILWLQPILTGQAVAYSPDGQLLATPTHGFRIAIYQAGQLVRFLEGSNALVTDIAFSPNGQALAAVNIDGQLLQWRLSDGRLLWQVSVFTSQAVCVAYVGADLIAVGGAEGQLQLRRASDGALIRTLSGHEETVRALAVAPNQAELVSVDDGGQARAWQVSDGRLLQAWQAHAGAATAVVWSPDGATLATAGDDGQIRLWNRNFQGEWRLVGTINAHEFGVARLAFANSTLLYSAGSFDGRVRLWNTATGTPVNELLAHPSGVLSMALRPDGRELATAGFEQEVRLWNPTTGALQGMLGGHRAPVAAVGITGSQVVSAGYEGVLRLWQFANGFPVGDRIAHDASIQAGAVAPTGGAIAVGDVAGQITVRALPSGNEIYRRGAHEGAVLCLAYSPDGTMLLSGGEDGQAKLWNAANGALMRTLSGHGGSVLSVAIGANLVATGDTAGQLRLWNPTTGQTVRVIDTQQGSILALAFSPDGTLIASGGADGTVKLWRIAEGTLHQAFVGHEWGATALVFVDAQRLFTADGTGYLRLLDVQVGTVLGQWQPTPGRIQSLALSTDRRHLVVGGDEGVALLRFTETLNRPPDPPALLEPAEGATVPRTPTFRVRISDPDHDPMEVELEIEQQGQRYTMRSAPQLSGAEVTLAWEGAPLRPGVATWRARAIDSQRSVSTWSELRTFTVLNNPPNQPELLEPADGATVSAQPRFRVRLTDPDGDRCRVIIQISGNNQDLVLRSSLVDSGAEVAVSVPERLAPGTYAWRAKSEDAFEARSDWTATRTFTVPQPNRAPDVPERLEPPNSATVSPTPVLRLRLSDPDGDRVKAIVQIRPANGESLLLEGDFVEAGSVAEVRVPATQPLAAGTYQWRARAIDSRNASSDWSEWWTFQVSEGNNGGGGDNPPANRPPSVPALLAPEANSIVSPTPILRVRAEDPDNDSLHYEIEIFTNDRRFLFTTGSAPSGQVVVFRVPAEPPLATGVWQWRARARDSAGNLSSWSEPRHFTVSDALPSRLQGVQTFGLNLQVSDTSLNALNLSQARVVEWDAATQQYRDADRIQVGKGYFVKADTPVHPELSGAPITGEVRIVLQPGWNLISNPYLTPFAWNLDAIRVVYAGETRSLRDAHSASWIEPYAWWWDGTQRQYRLVYDPQVVPNAQGEVPPGSGAWVLAWQPCELILSPSGRSRRAPLAERGGWSLRIQACVDEAAREVVLGVGTSLQAVAPPTPLDTSTPVQAHLRRAQALLSADLRSFTEPLEWTLEVMVAPAQAPRVAELRFPDLAYLSRAVTLVLYDHQAGRTVPLQGRGRYRFEVPAEGGVFRFRVQLVRTQMPLRILQPVVQGGRASGGQFTIQATLTAPAHAQVQIIAAGRAVRTLPPQFLRSAGMLQTTWDGRDDAGRALPPGTYLVQITAQTEDGQVARATIPLILTR
ncbi:MAG: hypothetical protein NZ550_00155 [Fimbriimonadales bacterium]|nr:hypothetical protein [Fimbriimonadales bacterium]MDW8052236.1 FlgD immunoglobulin-like domain containing protein [Armatimonadota bacterium]